MNFSLETLSVLILLLFPVIVLVNAVVIGYFVYRLLDLLRNSILTRLLKVTVVPLVFVFYLVHCFKNYFIFDKWIEGIFSGGGGIELTVLGTALVFLPSPLIILLLVAGYVAGWPGESEGQDETG